MPESAGPPGAASIACRSCRERSLEVLLDLGRQVPANTFPADPAGPDALERYPLRLARCAACGLVQLGDEGPVEIVPPGALAPSPSATLRAHQDAFAAEVVGRLGIVPGRRVVETASHGGYLHRAFASLGVPTSLLESSATLADEARAAEIDIERIALDQRSAEELAGRRGPADAIVDSYLLSHVPDLDEHLAGLAALLSPDGTLVAELDHLLPTVEGLQFDAIRHGHFTYLSLGSLAAALRRQGLAVVDASLQPVYGGALRAWIRPAAAGVRPAPIVAELLDRERAAGLDAPGAYRRFADGVGAACREVVAFLGERRDAGRRVAGYGAPSRGNTLLQTAGIGPDLLPFTVDRSAAKHGRYMAGTGIPILPPDALEAARPDVVLLLTWDIASEVIAQQPRVPAWAVPIPRLTILDGGRNPDLT